MKHILFVFAFCGLSFIWGCSDKDDAIKTSDPIVNYKYVITASNKIQEGPDLVISRSFDDISKVPEVAWANEIY